MLPTLTIHQPVAIDIDHEESDEGFFSLRFTFGDDAGIPRHIAICRDLVDSEPPYPLYIEADDQIHGFYTAHAQYAMNGTVLTLTLLDDNRFYWDDSQSTRIDIDPDRLEEVTSCLRELFAPA
jgi:hypothetical protein